jgi:ABC-type transport system substrate-binding protein
MENYWSKIARARISRRRTLAMGGGALGAALLAACGGDDDDEPTAPATQAGPTGASTGPSTGAASPTPAGPSSLVSEPADTTAKAKRGGIWKQVVTTEAISLDQITGNFGVQFHTAHTYSRLAQYTIGSVTSAPEGSMEPDAAVSWEPSPDGLTWTFTLRDGMKWDDRPPTSSRALATEDVLQSWAQFAELSTSRTQLANSATPDAPIESVEAPDESTIVFKLAFPFSAFMKSLNYPWHFSIMPVEAFNGGFDPKAEMRGTGPWMLTSYEPSQGYEYRSNPNWYGASDRPFLDGIDYPIITESATRETQFKAGNIWSLSTNTASQPSPDNLFSIKNEVPDAYLHATSPLVGNGSQNFLGFSKVPGNPWYTDVRLRRAVSLLIDRDAWIDVFGNVSGLEGEGIPVETAWNSHVPSTWPTIWTDPQGTELGEHAKWFQFDPEEAASLLEAAGMFGWEQPFTYHGSGGFGGDTLRQQNEVFAQMLQEGGHFTLDVRGDLIYDTDFRPNFLWAKGQYEGICCNHPLGSWPDWDMAFWSAWTPGSRNDWVGQPLPRAHDLMVQHRAEPDEEARVEIVKEWQRILAEDMWLVSYPGNWSIYELAWPWVGNANFFQPWTAAGAPVEEFIHVWHDTSKGPS